MDYQPIVDAIQRKDIIIVSLKKLKGEAQRQIIQLDCGLVAAGERRNKLQQLWNELPQEK